ncbi:hypothetical protein, partial [Burkholderia gladioli]|uniref:hypothetical protein n=1 Tax=Burkholderia gladioli TaxID=28095 RepID=UPI003F795743
MRLRVLSRARCFVWPELAGRALLFDRRVRLRPGRLRARAGTSPGHTFPANFGGRPRHATARCHGARCPVARRDHARMRGEC